MSVKKNSTSDGHYTNRLITLSENKLKKIFQVQLPYKIRVKHIITGRTLDVGCGIGRILKWLSADSIGVDHNLDSVQYCKKNGLNAWTVQDFEDQSHLNEKFEYLLFAHILEHLKDDEQKPFVQKYLNYLPSKGKVVIITPQMRGYKSDITHLTFTDDVRIESLLEDLELEIISTKSFPLPKFFGKYFKYNEFQVVAQKI